MPIFESDSPEMTRAIAHSFGASLPPSSIICLQGDLGAGKTTFVQGLVGEEGIVSSPTFQYLNIYPSKPLTIYHFDLYRLVDSDAFLSMGFDEYLFADGITCLEWPERIAPILPPNVLTVILSYIDASRRHISLPELP